MNLDEIKNRINNFPNKKYYTYNSLSGKTFTSDRISLVSAIYQNEIYLPEVRNITDIQRFLNDKSFDQELFSHDYFLRLYLREFSEKTIDIINQINPKIPIEIFTYSDIFSSEVKKFMKFKRENLFLECNGWITLNSLKKLDEIMDLSRDSKPTIAVHDVNPSTINNIRKCLNFFKDAKIKILLNDTFSFYYLNKLIPELRGHIVFALKDNIFDINNSNNARKLIFDKGFNVKEYHDSSILYRGITFDSFKEIFDLERLLEIVKSYIPYGASKLDIVTYISLFVSNYFQYDFNLIKKEKSYKSYDNFKDVTLLEFVNKGKGVCRHYAQFTKYILNSLDIGCEVIEAMGKDSLTKGHAFNVVKIENNSYFLDNTWLAYSMKHKDITDLSQSSDFLRSQDNFKHEEYSYDLRNYDCQDYDRVKVHESMKRVISWQYYKIKKDALIDMIRKNLFNRWALTNQKIEKSIPGKRA